jgi:dTDP-4-amino-4,6-dideoxygalactose transaminase
MTFTPIPMVDMQIQYLRLKTEIDNAVLNAMGEGRYINGPEVNLFARDLASYLDAKHVVTCANGTDALQLALMALNLQPGDEVITTSFSFFATAEVIALLGLVPVFADVDPSTYNIDCASVESLITPRTRCIIPVHLFGQGADMTEIMRIANKYNLFVVEDVAQALGGNFNVDGKKHKLGTIGHIGCTSFFPTKNLGCFGDGGAVITNDSMLADRIKLLASHGSKKQYIHEAIGVNSRLDTIQAAILSVKLKYLDGFIKSRQSIAEKYKDQLKNIAEIIAPGFQENANHTYNQFTIRVINGKRDSLQRYLMEQGISSRVYYPVALHQQPAMKGYLISNPGCNQSEDLCNSVLSLPIYPELDADNVEFIIQSIEQFFNNR